MSAVAVGDAAAGSMLESLVASLKPGGRMMARVRRAVPAGLAELARDGDVWVAQREASAAESAPVTLSRRSR
jgi:protein-L-isoaspartate O-methyltransferase